MNRDPIPGIEKLGYTLREASFLYLVAAHSGYFLRRQFAQFIDRVDGAMATHFLRKAEARGHVHVLGCGQHRQVIHVGGKAIYRLLGNEDSQNRRIKGEEEIQRRLMVLDYALENLSTNFLISEQQKVGFFHQQWAIPLAKLPQVAFRSADGRTQTIRYFIERLPVEALKANANQPSARFLYIDTGAATVKPFRRFLESHGSLFDALTELELVYVAAAEENFAEAEQEFYRRFPADAATKKFPRGIEHFLAYLKARQMWDGKNNSVPLEQWALLREGIELYAMPKHEVMVAQWKAGAVREPTLRVEFSARTGMRRFTPYRLEVSYPFGAPRYRGRT